MQNGIAQLTSTPPVTSRARQLNFSSPPQQHAGLQQSPIQSRLISPVSTSRPAIQDTPYWTRHQPGPNVFTEAWPENLDSVRQRHHAVHTAPLPDQVYDPRIGTSAIAPLSFAQMLSDQITARVLVQLPIVSAAQPAASATHLAAMAPQHAACSRAQAAPATSAAQPPATQQVTANGCDRCVPESHQSHICNVLPLRHVCLVCLLCSKHVNHLSVCPLKQTRPIACMQLEELRSSTQPAGYCMDRI